MASARLSKNGTRRTWSSIATAVLVSVALSSALIGPSFRLRSWSATAFGQPWQVQHPLDGAVDMVLSPVWRLLEPLVSVVGYALMSPVRMHFRLEGMRTESRSEAVISDAATRACERLHQVLIGETATFHAEWCPKVVVIRGEHPQLASFKLGRGRHSLLVATEPLAQFSDAELRFVIGREIGHGLLHHGAPMPSWVMARFVSDSTALPRYIASGVGRLAGFVSHAIVSRRAPESDVGKGKTVEDYDDDGENTDSRLASDALLDAQLQFSRVADSVLELCELCRGPLRAGSWPGLSGLNVDALLSGAGSLESVALEQALTLEGASIGQLLDVAADVCLRLRNPGGAQVIGAALLGSAGPHVAARVFNLTSDAERQLSQALRLGAWGFGAYARKVRAESLSADRLGLIAAAGDLRSSLRAMVRLNQDESSTAMVALLGERQLVQQADVLTRALPPQPFASLPSLPSRVSELTRWSRSVSGRRFSGGGR